MKLTTLILTLIISSTLFAECIVERKTRWRESSSNKFALEVFFRDDRNLMIDYVDQDSNDLILLSHKIYSCSGKYLYAVPDREEHSELFALIEEIDDQNIRLHFVDRYERIKSIISFKKVD